MFDAEPFLRVLSDIIGVICILYAVDLGKLDRFLTVKNVKQIILITIGLYIYNLYNEC